MAETVVQIMFYKIKYYANILIIKFISNFDTDICMSCPDLPIDFKMLHILWKNMRINRIMASSYSLEERWCGNFTQGPSTLFAFGTRQI